MLPIQVLDTHLEQFSFFSHSGVAHQDDDVPEKFTSSRAPVAGQSSRYQLPFRFIIKAKMSSMLFHTAGTALIVAGIFQLTPWKSACLRHCRDPLAVVAQHLHGGWRGALHLGVHHGAFCAACCWALMLIQLVLGVMNLSVMVLVGIVIALEKLIPRGELVARIGGTLSILGGLALAARSPLSGHLGL